MAKARGGKRPAEEREIPASKWKRIRDAYLGPGDPTWSGDLVSLKELAKRFAVPLLELQRRASLDEWELERTAKESRWFLGVDVPGATTEAEFCTRKALQRLAMKADLIPIGGEAALDAEIRDARVVWRRHMGAVMLWEATKASPHYARQRVKDEHHRPPQRREARS